MRKRNFSKAVLATTATLAIILGTASAANAATEYPEGGTWRYGVYEPASVSYVYSNYYHPGNWHRSSVIRGVNDSTVYRSGDKAAGVWANVEKTVAGLSGRKSFYFKYSY